MYLRPTDLGQALAALKAGPLTILAGGTDFYPARVGRPVREDVLDISALPDLQAIGETSEGWRIGALATWSDIAAHALPPIFDGLKLAAREIGGRQIQNAGTLAGNVCNASPAADGVPVLLSLGAEVELASVAGLRRLPLAAFITGNRRTERRPDELLTAIVVPRWPDASRATFRKLGARRYLVISIVAVALALALDRDGRIERAGLAVSACSEIAQRLPTLEAELCGQVLTGALAQHIRPEHLADLTPISDVRGTAEYRRDAALTLLRRALAEVAGEA